MRILLVEDEPDIGAAIQTVLTQNKYVVDWVQDGAQAWEYLDNQWAQYTVAIFDWMLPGITGLELCQKLRSHNSCLPVLMLTARDDFADRVMGLDAGADDYLVKPFNMAEFLARVRALHRRSPEFRPQQLQVGSLCLDYGSSTISIQTPEGEMQTISLTAKEFQLLEYFMQHPNQILSRDQILNRLWEFQSESASNVVAAQMRLLRRKLEEYRCDHFIETVYGLGYRLNIPHE
jgi:DNA-binding response OmpR family regulator